MAGEGRRRKKRRRRGRRGMVRKAGFGVKNVESDFSDMWLFLADFGGTEKE